jgi:hypothetical protein
LGRTLHVWCEDGGSLYDAIGPEFTLSRFDPAADVAPLAARNRGAVEDTRYRTAKYRHLLWRRAGIVAPEPACGLALR